MATRSVPRNGHLRDARSSSNSLSVTDSVQVIIDSIVAGASPLKLEYVPISSSLAVAMDGTEIKRSRTNGFDYRSSANSLVFINVKYKKGSEVISSYKRWRQGLVVQ